MISDHPKRFEFDSVAKFNYLHYHTLEHVFRTALYNGSIVFLNNASVNVIRVSVDILISMSEHISVRCNNGGLKRMIIWH